MLQVSGLRVTFDGFHAIDGFDFSMEEGELRFLIGPNGAGKTTLVDAITGRVKVTGGSIRFESRRLDGRREHQIVRLGVGRTFQTPSIFANLTVVENVDLAASFRRSLPELLRRRGGISPEVAAALELTDLAAHGGRLAGTLSHGQQQWLEIAMLLAQDPRLLLLDEPVAGMTKDERVITGNLLQSIARQHAVLVIEHDMDFMRRFARVVTVMHEGRLLREGSVAEIQADPQVREVYLGVRRDRHTQVEAV